MRDKVVVITRISEMAHPEWAFDIRTVELYRHDDGSRAYRLYAAEPGTDESTQTPPLAAEIRIDCDLRAGKEVASPTIIWEGYESPGEMLAWQYARILNVAAELACTRLL